MTEGKSMNRTRAYLREKFRPSATGRLGIRSGARAGARAHSVPRVRAQVMTRIRAQILSEAVFITRL